MIPLRRAPRANALRPHACALALLSFAAACGGEDTSGPPDAEPPHATDVATAPDPPSFTLEADAPSGAFHVELRAQGDAIPVNAPFDVELVVTDADGEPFDGGDTITLDARMPEHGHGMLRDVELERTEPGHWRAEGLLLHMVGYWEFHVDVRRGARIERAQTSHVLAH